jgi:hypothetical protein
MMLGSTVGVGEGLGNVKKVLRERFLGDFVEGRVLEDSVCRMYELEVLGKEFPREDKLLRRKSEEKIWGRAANLKIKGFEGLMGFKEVCYEVLVRSQVSRLRKQGVRLDQMTRVRFSIPKFLRKHEKGYMKALELLGFEGVFPHAASRQPSQISQFNSISQLQSSYNVNLPPREPITTMNLASPVSEYHLPPQPKPRKFLNLKNSQPVLPSRARFHKVAPMNAQSKAGLYDYLKKFNTNFMLNGLGKVITSQKVKISTEAQYQISETKQADLVLIKKILDRYWSRKSKQLLGNCEKSHQQKFPKRKPRYSYMQSAFRNDSQIDWRNEAALHSPLRVRLGASTRGSQMGIDLSILEPQEGGGWESFDSGRCEEGVLRVLDEIRKEGEDKAQLEEETKKRLAFDFKANGEQRNYIDLGLVESKVAASRKSPGRAGQGNSSRFCARNSQECIVQKRQTASLSN